MKSKYITTIIFEGTDGVGKDTLSFAVWKRLNFKYHVYVRGEISDYVYAKKFNRPIITTQNGLPFLYVVLTASKEHLIRNIEKREKRLETKEEELAKMKDNELFLQAANELKHLYHIVVVDVSDLSIEDATSKLLAEISSYVNNMQNDREINEFNEMYRLGCHRAGYRFTVKGNQPFINDIMVMADAHLHNGIFETYSNKQCPHNLLFSFAYKYGHIKLAHKHLDFVYPINSKVLQRPEVYDYLTAFCKADKTVLTTDSIYLPHTPNMYFIPKIFGDDYIFQLSQARATIYTSRDLANLKMMTVRAYESVIAENVIFVDKLTDKDCEILKQIYTNENDKWIIDLLYVTPETIVKNYEFIISHPGIEQYIIDTQKRWYEKFIKEYKVDYDRQ